MAARGAPLIEDTTVNCVRVSLHYVGATW